MTVLMRAALSNSVDCLSYLLSLNHPTKTNRPLVNVNQTDANGLTVLHYANGNVDAMRLLIEYPYKDGDEIDVNHQNKFEESALHWASRWGETECVKTLLSHPDIDLTLKNHAGMTAEDICCYHIGRSVNQKPIILKLLQEKAPTGVSTGKTTKKRRCNQSVPNQEKGKNSMLQMFLLFLLAGVMASLFLNRSTT
jgi:ankyrin repeat protein